MDIRKEVVVMHFALHVFVQLMRNVANSVNPYANLIIGRMRSSNFELISILLYVSQYFSIIDIKSPLLFISLLIPTNDV